VRPAAVLGGAVSVGAPEERAAQEQVGRSPVVVAAPAPSEVALATTSEVAASARESARGAVRVGGRDQRAARTLRAVSSAPAAG